MIVDAWKLTRSFSCGCLCSVRIRQNVSLANTVPRAGTEEAIMPVQAHPARRESTGPMGPPLFRGICAQTAILASSRKRLVPHPVSTVLRASTRQGLVLRQWRRVSIASRASTACTRPRHRDHAFARVTCHQLMGRVGQTALVFQAVPDFVTLRQALVRMAHPVPTWWEKNGVALHVSSNIRLK